MNTAPGNIVHSRQRINTLATAQIRVRCGDDVLVEFRIRTVYIAPRLPVDAQRGIPPAGDVAYQPAGSLQPVAEAIVVVILVLQACRTRCLAAPGPFPLPASISQPGDQVPEPSCMG